jgi:glycosyltransferase involved in cell wall biosynthesis
MTKPPVVSVLMPVYNGDRYLVEAVESVLSQTFVDFELLISDNASTDRTLSILENYTVRDARVRLIRRQSPSLVQSLNALIDLSQGEFLARIDADDIALPSRLLSQVAFLRDHPEIVCVGTSYIMIDAMGRRLKTDHRRAEDREIQEEALCGITPLAHPTVMMRRAAVTSVGGYDVRWNYAEDLDLWLRLGEIGALANMAAVTLMYRVHEKSRTLEDVETQARCVRAIVEEAYVRRRIDRDYVAPHFDSLPVGRRARHDKAASLSYWALKEGERRTSLVYGARATWLAPWRPLGWKLVIRALIGL